MKKDRVIKKMIPILLESVYGAWVSYWLLGTLWMNNHKALTVAFGSIMGIIIALLFYRRFYERVENQKLSFVSFYSVLTLILWIGGSYFGLRSKWIGHILILFHVSVSPVTETILRFCTGSLVGQLIVSVIRLFYLSFKEKGLKINSK